MMKKFLVYLLVAALSGAVVFLYLSKRDEIEDDEYERRIEQIEEENNSWKEKTERWKDDAEELSKDTARLASEAREERRKRIEVEREAAKGIKEIDSLSIDSVASFVAKYYGGDYKIVKAEKGVFVAFKDTTTRNIAKGVIRLKKLRRIEISYENELNKKDSLITSLSNIVLKKDSLIGGYENRINLAESKDSLRVSRIENLEKKIKRYKLVGGAGAVVAGVLIVLL